MLSLWPARVSTGVLVAAATLVLVLVPEAARRWTSLTVLMMVQRQMTDVYTAGVKWGAMETWLHAMTLSASASG
jgi:hypothetical protein